MLLLRTLLWKLWLTLWLTPRDWLWYLIVLTSRFRCSCLSVLNSMVDFVCRICCGGSPPSVFGHDEDVPSSSSWDLSWVAVRNYELLPIWLMALFSLKRPSLFLSMLWWWASTCWAGYYVTEKPLSREKRHCYWISRYWNSTKRFSC